MESLIAFFVACAEAAMEPKVEGQPRKLRASVDTIALMVAALALVVSVLMSGWLLYKSGVLEEKVDRTASGVERIENALISRAVARATPGPAPMQAHGWTGIIPPAYAEAP